MSTICCLTILANTDRSGTVINQLFPNFRGIRNRGRDVWQILEFNPIVFWYMTGETAEAMVEKVYLDVIAPRHLPRTPRTDRRRRCILDARNRVLLVIIWLRQYLKLHQCTSPYVSDFKKYRCRRNYLPYRPSSNNLKFQTLHHMT